MNCNQFKYYISEYIDDEIKDSKREEFVQHMNKCSRCRQEYEQIKNLVKQCRSIPEIDLPEDYQQQLHQKFEKKINLKDKKEGWVMHFNWKKFTAIAAILLVIVISASLLKPILYTKIEGQSDSAANDEYTAEIHSEGEAGLKEDTEAEYVAEDLNESGGQTADASTEQFASDASSWQGAVEDRKIITNARILMQTAEFDNALNAIKDLVNMRGGYVKSSQISGFGENIQRTAYIELKVPHDKFSDFTDMIKDYGQVIEISESGEDITEQYFDAEVRLKTLKLQEDRLLKLLEKAEQLDTILKLENELTRIRTEIENITGTLKKWDHMVEYATIYLEITEIKKEQIGDTNGQLWHRISNSFIKSLNMFVKMLEWIVIFIVAVIPYIPIIILVIWLIKRYIMKRY